MAVTPFLKLQKPPFDTIPWDQAVNGNMDTIDAFISRYMAVPNYVGAWANGVSYVSGQNVLDITNATIYLCQVTHTSSAAPTTFTQDRTTYPTYWLATTNVTTGAGTSLTVTDVTPASAKSGDLWWNSAEGQLYILYNDGNSLQWVIANNQAGNIGDAPRDGSIYGRQMGSWVASQSIADVGRNKLHNGLFNVQQRGAGPFTASVYSADRWTQAFTGTLSTSILTLVDADRTAIGDEAAQWALQCVCVGAAGAGDITQSPVQFIETVRRLAGKTVTVSFWARAASGTPRVGLELYQNFGTGGSPSALVLGIGSQAFTLSTTWTRYTSTAIAVPSASGKVFGSNGNDCTAVVFWMSSGTTNAARAGNIGVQSYTLQLWGVQLEIGSIATPLEKPDPRYDLANCYRFYQSGYFNYYGYATAGTAVSISQQLQQTMRAQPTIATSATTVVNLTGPSVVSIFFGSFYVAGTATATGPFGYNGTWFASADL